MRKLNTQDVFSLARIVRASAVKDQLVALIKDATSKNKSVEDIGIIGFLTIFEAMTEKNAESAIYTFLSGPFEMTPGEVAALDLSSLLQLLSRLCEENNLKDFFGWLSGILGKL